MCLYWFHPLLANVAMIDVLTSFLLKDRIIPHTSIYKTLGSPLKHVLCLGSHIDYSPMNDENM